MADLMRCSNIWYRYFNQVTLYCGIAVDKIENVFSRSKNIETDNPEDICEGLISVELTLLKESAIST